MAAKRKSTKRKYPAKAKVDIKQQVTDEIISQLKTCGDNWKRPWINEGRSMTTPINGTTRRAYSGGNIMALWTSAIKKGYTSAEWASYDQWFRAGGGEKDAAGKIIKPSRYQVRGGENGTPIRYSGKLKDKKDETKPDAKDKYFRYEKWSSVFNAEQVDGYVAKAVKLPSLAERHAAADEFVRNLLADIGYGHDRAYYSPSLDHIKMPRAEAFKNTEHGSAMAHFYSTLLHELGHWTGAEKRLNRQFGAKGTQDYAREELRAELIAAFLCAHLGIDSMVREDHAIYIGGYIRALEDHAGELFAAAADAQKAMNFMIAMQPVKDEDEESEDGLDEEEDAAEENETADEEELEDA